MNKVIDQFHQKLIDKGGEHKVTNPDFFIVDFQKFISVEIPFSISNENSVKRSLEILQSFIHYKLEIAS